MPLFSETFLPSFSACTVEQRNITVRLRKSKNLLDFTKFLILYAADWKNSVRFQKLKNK